MQCMQLTGKKRSLYLRDQAPLSSSCSNSWGWLPSLVRADSYGHHHTAGLRQRLMCCNGELKARQECQQGSRQQKVFAGAGTWSGNRDQLCLELAGLLRSPRAFCRNVCGWEAGEDWRFGSPPLGSSFCPPLRALPRLLQALSPLCSMPPPTHSDHDHAACSDVVTMCLPLFNHEMAIYKVPPLHKSSAAADFHINCLVCLKTGLCSHQQVN